MATEIIGFALWKDGRFWLNMNAHVIPRIGEEICIESNLGGWTSYKVEGVVHYPQKGRQTRVYIKEIR